MLKVKIKIKN